MGSDLNHQLSPSVITYRLAFLGSQHVGKSSLITRYLFNSVREDYVPTYEDQFTQQVTVDGVDCEVEILDTPGSEETFYKVLVAQSVMVQGNRESQAVLEGCKKIIDRDAILLVYDITNKDSFTQLESYYQFILDSYNHIMKRLSGAATKEFPPVVICGTKCDLERGVDRETAERYASNKNCPYIEATSKEQESASEVFEMVIRELRKRKIKKRETLLMKSQSSSDQCGCFIF
ncbi:hypothetical protein FGO68_gene7939 [Halteria grandinella]|uniref:Uncharacterized protein n=1 Tax=Halteria grandinella TaxID=5974 RepID=A0A8J8NMW0_HALGN|nr:hypothetical protein FGO68_gene7939 [Halteria grandinella]